MDNSRLPYLLRQQSASALTSEEWSELEAMVSNVEDEALQAQLVELLRQHEAEPVELNGALMEATFARVVSTDKQQAEATAVGPMHRVHFLKTAWFRYAAAIIIVIGIAAYLWNTQKEKENPSVVQGTNPAPMEDVPAPTSNRATLTLAGGQKIFLDSASNGTLAKQGSTQIRKNDDGSIIYDGNKVSDNIVYNTLTVPRGSQVANIRLADGTTVFLNAASSLTYPVAFVGKERMVEITGEAYFEVAKDITKPFIVRTPKEDIRVLGTHFNVNAYADEEAIKTSLLEGSVKVGEKVLKPGQAYLNGKVIQTDVEQDVAWKNGRFMFGAGTKVPAVLRQVSRWYNVEVMYEGKVSGTIGGSLSRQENISKVLELMQSTGTISYRLEGKRVVILPPQNK